MSGVVPLGAFLVLHLWTNARALAGRQPFDDAVEATTRIPFALVLEVVFILIPLLFHAGYGIRIAVSSKPNLAAYPFSKNWGYAMQRLTGLIALAFIVLHVWQFRAQRFSGKLLTSDYYGELCAGLSSTHAGVPWMALGYLLGLAAVVFHFTNGLYGFCFSWGITSSRRATRVSSALFGSLGVVLFALGAAIVIYFATGSRLLFAADGAGVFSTTMNCQNELALDTQTAPKDPSEPSEAQHEPGEGGPTGASPPSTR